MVNSILMKDKHVISPELGQHIDSLSRMSRIQKSSSKLLYFFVRDILDF